MMELDITELFEEVVRKLPEGLEILYPNGKGGAKIVKSPRLNYIFGSSQYIKDTLDEYSQSSSQSEKKFPLVALFTPISEDRGDPDYFSKAKVSLTIVCSSCKEWSNEERRTTSFKNILRPIYKRLLEVLCEDSRFDCDCDEKVKHSYSENYSYGRYGAYTDSGKAVSEPIDAINIRSMEIKINNLNCRRK
ncbi:hypothetical protein [Bacteroides sp. AF32-8BH]|uniref:hypothetical protein n=1 Tax=Bacteroides sp. AF32-8BH TaxID=2302925 RepID=UPI000E4055A7|nr:hypothetical protein [Bacteroides sp. AF32-8BH]RGE81395.1 hypothetical protein DWZ47_03125 [Bacteroides sp. AF32-8BH]